MKPELELGPFSLAEESSSYPARYLAEEGEGEGDNFNQQVLALCLLALSSCFMTVAWYLHLKFPELAMWIAILGSWGIALFEYALQVPGNRLGHEAGLSASQLKIFAEAFTLLAFVVFSRTVLDEKVTVNFAVALLLVLSAVVVAVKGPWTQVLI